MPTPIKENCISEDMSKLADFLDVKRFVDDGQDDAIIGNLAWVVNEKMIYCPIAAVVDLIKNDSFEDVNNEKHRQFLENYGSLSLFPTRLRELAQHFENAAIAAIDLNFLTIPDFAEDCSDCEEDDEDEDENDDDDEESENQDDSEDE